MKKSLVYTALLCAMTVSTSVKAGNEDRAGQAGASELLINPWARSSGWNGIGSAMVRGVEAMNLNVGGLSFNRGTEVVFSHTNWLSGSDIKINSFGLAQKVGQSGALGLSIMSMDFGDIERTTETLPDGGAGTYTPQFLTIGLGYSKEFSNAIRGGLVLRLVSESIADIKASGFAIDAGIQYVTGFNTERDNLKFGIALRNVGPSMKYEGEGLSFRNDNSTTNINVLQEQRSQQFELPAQVNISIAYDIKLAEDHRLTPAASFTSNSFVRDQVGVGAEYSFRNFFSARMGYLWDIEGKDALTTGDISSIIGPSAGVSFMIPVGRTGTKFFGIDYSFRSTETFNGTHSIGAILKL